MDERRTRGARGDGRQAAAAQVSVQPGEGDADATGGRGMAETGHELDGVELPAYEGVFVSFLFQLLCVTPQSHPGGNPGAN